MKLLLDGGKGMLVLHSYRVWLSNSDRVITAEQFSTFYGIQIVLWQNTKAWSNGGTGGFQAENERLKLKTCEPQPGKYHCKHCYNYSHCCLT